MYEIEFLWISAMFMGGMVAISYFMALVLCLTLWRDRLPRLRLIEIAMFLFGLGAVVFLLGLVISTYLSIFADAYATGYGSSGEIVKWTVPVIGLLVLTCLGMSIFCFCLGLTRSRHTNSASQQLKNPPSQPERLPWQD